MERMADRRLLNGMTYLAGSWKGLRRVDEGEWVAGE
jgi:hypothetical protein